MLAKIHNKSPADLLVAIVNMAFVPRTPDDRVGGYEVRVPTPYGEPSLAQLVV